MLIPHQKVPDLQLRPDVVDAVAAGKFRVFGVETVDQGIQILTGEMVEAIDAKVQGRLKEFQTALRSGPARGHGTGKDSQPVSSQEPPGPPPPVLPVPTDPPTPGDPREPR